MVLDKSGRREAGRNGGQQRPAVSVSAFWCTSRKRLGWADLADLLDRQRLARDGLRVVKIS